MSNLVEVRNLRVSAKTDSGRTVEIIRNVSFDIAEGEIVALIGESGSGKTTIALTLMGYTRSGCRIVEGSVKLAGQEISALPERKRASKRGTEVSYVPQSAAASFNPAHKIMDQVIEVTKIHHLMPIQQAREKAVELFRALALPDPDTIGDRYPHQVSGGQLQRLSAAMALIGDPELVIFDEPTTALDVTTQVEVLRAFREAVRERHTTAVYVSHDLAVVAQIADRIVVLRDGAMRETGPTSRILSEPADSYTKSLLAAAAPWPQQSQQQQPSAAAPLLEVHGLTAGYGRIDRQGRLPIPVLHDISLGIRAGFALGVIGQY